MQAANILFQTARASFGQVTVRLGSSTLTCAESELNALQNWPQPDISNSSAFSGRIEKGFLSKGRGAVIQSLPKNSVKYHQTASHISITETSHLLIASPPQNAAASNLCSHAPPCISTWFWRFSYLNNICSLIFVLVSLYLFQNMFFVHISLCNVFQCIHIWIFVLGQTLRLLCYAF